MRSETAQLLEELRQICAQYAAEVPGKRRPWPESIKTRVFRLRFLGFSNHRIAQEIGIPVMTLYCWKMPSAEKARALPAPEAEEDTASGEFMPVRVVKRRTGLPTPAPLPTRSGKRGPRLAGNPIMTVKTSDRHHSSQKRSTPPTVTVVHPSGIRLEGLTLEQAIDAARKLSRS